MRDREIRLGIGMVAVSVLLIAWLIPSKVEIFALGTFAESSLGPRSFPNLIALLIGVLGVAVLFDAWRQPKTAEEKTSIPLDAIKRVMAVLATSVLYLWLITLFGYMLPTFLATMTLMYVFGERRWWLMLLISALTAISLYLVFGKVFHMLMPRGSIEFFYEL